VLCKQQQTPAVDQDLVLDMNDVLIDPADLLELGSDADLSEINMMIGEWGQHVQHVEHDTTHIMPRLVVEHPGYFRQTSEGHLVFELRDPNKEYKSLQGAARRIFGALLKINITAQVTAGTILELDPLQSSVEMYLAEKPFDKLEFAVQADSFDAATGDLTLKLTATAESYMQLAIAINDLKMQHSAVKQGIVQFNLHFGAAGVMEFRSSFIWRSRTTLQNLTAGEYIVTFA
jgi:hypothetical protein